MHTFFVARVSYMKQCRCSLELDHATLELLQALGILDGTWEPSKPTTRSKAEYARAWRNALVRNAPSGLRMAMDIKQHENALTLVFPRGIAGWLSILEHGFSAVGFASVGTLCQLFLAERIIAPGFMIFSVIVLAWCVLSPCMHVVSAPEAVLSIVGLNAAPKPFLSRPLDPDGIISHISMLGFQRDVSS
jgi:hypothetical protein